ncbi:hypothetical protein EVAR_60123_1 [Eumeta japonica]|uniref:Cytidyltransferase-like domain-containing protein n=1 Tax=Eumeta variegata TaxID=151549 RepID=A0A4C1ZRL7_EUMVA|nr:hypothetical protein EVAR_60123_1 [Eumeta japonica]
MGLGTVVGGVASPVHDAYGKKDLVAAHHRVSMLKLALRGSSWIKVSEWETQQNGWTRTKLSLQYHQDMINNYMNSTNRSAIAPPWLPDDILNVNSIDEPDEVVNMNGNFANCDSGQVQVKLLCGADLLESFATPGLWSDEDLETILSQHGLVVVSRSGSDPGRFIHESDMLYKYRRNVILVTNYIANEVSSTVLRQLMRRGESAKYLTDDAVLAYIRQYQLYGARPLDNKDKPSKTDETPLIKRPKKSNFLMPHCHTDSVSPMYDVLPKVAYVDKVPSTYVPGKAVKIVSDKKSHFIEDSDKVRLSEATHMSLDSYLCARDDVDGGSDSDDMYKRRVSAGNVENTGVTEKIKKRCSASTIRKLSKKPTDMKKSKSEVVKLCERMKNVKIKERDSGKNYKTRSCNDIVKLVLTKHGIHVISDTEAIV